MKFSIKDFFSKCDQISNFLRIWSYLLKRSLMENFIFCAVMKTEGATDEKSASMLQSLDFCKTFKSKQNQDYLLCLTFFRALERLHFKQFNTFFRRQISGHLFIDCLEICQTIVDYVRVSAHIKMIISIMIYFHLKIILLDS